MSKQMNKHGLPKITGPIIQFDNKLFMLKLIMHKVDKQLTTIPLGRYEYVFPNIEDFYGFHCVWFDEPDELKSKIVNAMIEQSYYTYLHEHGIVENCDDCDEPNKHIKCKYCNHKYSSVESLRSN